MKLLVLLLGLSTACHPRTAPRDDVSTARDTTRVMPPPPAAQPPEESAPPAGALSAAQRDSLIREVQARRAAWRAHGIIHYRIRVAVGCMCPWPKTPAVVEVRDGRAVALRDTTGRDAGPVREPWSRYTVEGLFDRLEWAAQHDDVVAATYDARFGYPTTIRGDRKLGRYDDWYAVTAGPLAPTP